MIMLTSESFRNCDIYIDHAYEHVKLRWEKATEKVYRRFYGEKETEIDHTSELFNEAIGAGEVIARDDYFRD